MPSRFFFPRRRCLALAPLLALFPIGRISARAPVAADTAKWIATNDARWQATYKREIAEPFQNAVAELRRQYLASLSPPLAAATQAGRRKEAVAWPPVTSTRYSTPKPPR